ncbi:MAG: NUDIX domain-containing protein [Ilumatobacteraceae bacterium]
MTKPSEASKPYDLNDYPRFEVTVDIALFSVIDRALHVLLVQRGEQTERNKWALPGGFKKADETLDQAAARELVEETNVTAPRHLAQFRAYGDPGRDPRGNVVTVAYLAAVPTPAKVVGGSDARHAAVVPVADVLTGKRKLAFDHRRIVTDAVDHIAGQLEGSDLAFAFLHPSFALSDLRGVHEAITGKQLDPANFRRDVLGADPPLLRATGRRANSGVGGGRPAELFTRVSRSR